MQQKERQIAQQVEAENTPGADSAQKPLLIDTTTQPANDYFKGIE
jgi:hypothetical protein